MSGLLVNILGRRRRRRKAASTSRHLHKQNWVIMTSCTVSRTFLKTSLQFHFFFNKYMYISYFSVREKADMLLAMFATFFEVSHVSKKLNKHSVCA